MAHGRGDLDTASGLAERGVALGRELRCADLESEALQALGRMRIDQGRPAEGLALLDEAMLFAVEGRLSPYSTGKVYCSLISACEQLSDHQRAAEWTATTARWAERHPLAVFPGLCRVHYATALGLRGDWAEAEREATRACEELTDVNLPNAAAAWAEIGDIRRRLGDLAGAEAAFRAADQLCPQPRAGLALLRLAEGDLDAAGTIVTEALEGAAWNRLARGQGAARARADRDRRRRPHHRARRGRRARDDRHRLRQHRAASRRDVGARTAPARRGQPRRMRHPSQRDRPVDRHRHPVRGRHRADAAGRGLPQHRR